MFNKNKIDKKISKKPIQYEMGAGRLNQNHKYFLSLIQELDLEKDLIEISGNSQILPSKNYDLKPIFKNKSSFTYIKK